MQGEFTNLGQQVLLPGFELLGKIARMAAQSFRALSDEIVFPLLNLGKGQRVLASSLCGGGLALEEFDDQCGLALGGPALGTVRFDILDVGRV